MAGRVGKYGELNRNRVSSASRGRSWRQSSNLRLKKQRRRSTTGGMGPAGSGSRTCTDDPCRCGPDSQRTWTSGCRGSIFCSSSRTGVRQPLCRRCIHVSWVCLSCQSSRGSLPMLYKPHATRLHCLKHS